MLLLEENLERNNYSIWQKNIFKYLLIHRNDHSTTCTTAPSHSYKWTKSYYIMHTHQHSTFGRTSFLAMILLSVPIFAFTYYSQHLPSQLQSMNRMHFLDALEITAPAATRHSLSATLSPHRNYNWNVSLPIQLHWLNYRICPINYFGQIWHPIHHTEAFSYATFSAVKNKKYSFLTWHNSTQ